MPRKSFNELRAKMSAERRSRNEGAAQEMLTEMALAQLRNAAGLTRVELAEAMGISSAEMSQMEREGELQVAALHRIVEAIGGELELVVTLATGARIRISRLREVVEPAA